MIHDIASILHTFILTLPFADKTAGLVKIGEKEMQNPAEGKTFLERKPIAYNADLQKVIREGRYSDLVPNGEYKSLMYFEDVAGFTPTSEAHEFEAKLLLVTWVNTLKLKIPYEMATTTLPLMSMQKLPYPASKIIHGKDILGGDEHWKMYHTLRIRSIRSMPTHYNLFGKYSYKESGRQFLMYPYAAYGLELTVTWKVAQSCLLTFDDLLNKYDASLNPSGIKA